ncbi:hypothetical protein ACSVDA_22510 [Cytobacillus sp. Hm23]
MNLKFSEQMIKNAVKGGIEHVKKATSVVYGRNFGINFATLVINPNIGKPWNINNM